MGAACALLESPPQPVIPTPPPAADRDEAIAFESVGSGGAPAAGVLPAVDLDIFSLLEQVSRQNLFAYVQTLQNFRTRHTLSNSEGDTGIGAARRWIFEEFERVGDGHLRVAYDDFPLILDGVTSNQRNVVAILPGTGSYPGVIILGAHYDSAGADAADPQLFAPGADNNGSGVALLLETARLLSSRSWQQTIMFVAFAAHEQGTFGSKAFVRRVMLDGMIIDAALINDTVGGRSGVPQSVRLFAAGPASSSHSQLARYVSFIGELYMPTFPVDIIGTLDRPGRFGDQREFVNAGVPSVRITESEEDPDLLHSPDDTADEIDYSYLAKVVALNVAAVANMAGGPHTPPTPAVAPMAEAGNYLLSWTPDPQAAGYAVVFRPAGGEETILRFIAGAEAGNVAITGMDPSIAYAISVAPIDAGGRVGRFSEEVVTQ